MKLLFLGPPGSGKGTIAEKVAEEFKVTPISTGNLFRENIKSRTELGSRVKSILESGKLVSDDLTVSIVKDRLKKGDLENGFILDGFPRTIPQAEALAQFCTLDRIISFTLNDELVVERVSGRRLCKGCGAGYHISFMPPKREGVCDKCGGELYTRDDDKPETVKERLKAYYRETEPLIEYYKTSPLFNEISGEGSPQEVYMAVRETLLSL